MLFLMKEEKKYQTQIMKHFLLQKTVYLNNWITWQKQMMAIIERKYKEMILL